MLHFQLWELFGPTLSTSLTLCLFRNSDANALQAINFIFYMTQNLRVTLSIFSLVPIVVTFYKDVFTLCVKF